MSFEGHDKKYAAMREDYEWLLKMLTRGMTQVPDLHDQSARHTLTLKVSAADIEVLFTLLGMLKK